MRRRRNPSRICAMTAMTITIGSTIGEKRTGATIGCVERYCAKYAACTRTSADAVIARASFALRLADEGPHSGLGVGRIADLDPVERLGECFDDLVVDRTLGEDPRRQRAALPGVDREGERGAGREPGDL